MNGTDLERIDLLILLRLATSAKALSRAALHRDLFPFVARKMDERVWHEWCDARLQKLQAAGDLDEAGRLSARGREHLLAAVDLRALPKSWTDVKSSLLPGLALGMSAHKAKSLKSGALQGTVIARSEGLALGETPTPAAAVDAVCWKAMGFDTTEKLVDTRLKLRLLERELGMRVNSIGEAVDALCWRALGQPQKRPFKAPAVRKHVLGKVLGTTPHSTGTSHLAGLLAARAAGASKTDAASLRAALQERWLFADGAGAKPHDEAKETTTSPPADGAGTTNGATVLLDASAPLPQWAASVQRIAAAVPNEGRYDDDRVFISAAWRAARDANASISLDQFKQRLVDANREGLLRLHRADLVGAMDPTLVAESATTFMNATFHFIVAKEARP